MDFLQPHKSQGKRGVQKQNFVFVICLYLVLRNVENDASSWRILDQEINLGLNPRLILVGQNSGGESYFWRKSETRKHLLPSMHFLEPNKISGLRGLNPSDPLEDFFGSFDLFDWSKTTSDKKTLFAQKC